MICNASITLGINILHCLLTFVYVYSEFFILFGTVFDQHFVSITGGVGVSAQHCIAHHLLHRCFRVSMAQYEAYSVYAYV